MLLKIGLSIHVIFTSYLYVISLCSFSYLLLISDICAYFIYIYIYIYIYIHIYICIYLVFQASFFAECFLNTYYVLSSAYSIVMEKPKVLTF